MTYRDTAEIKGRGIANQIIAAHPDWTLRDWQRCYRECQSVDYGTSRALKFQRRATGEVIFRHVSNLLAEAR